MQSLLAVVDLRAIRSNAQAVIRYAKRPLIAVVKDDAYGHGAEVVAHALADMVLAFAVATVEEGVRLRVSGITSTVLVLTPPLTKEEAARLAYYNLTATLSSLRSVALFAGIAGVEAHIAVNTGMNRYGVRPEQIKTLCQRAAASGINVTGIFSHLYAPECGASVCEQTARFTNACMRAKAYFPQAVCHLAATGGVLAGVRADVVRAGLALYGYLPAEFEGKLAVKPALKVYATVAESRMRLGGGVGYGKAQGDEHELYTVRVGYGDGFFRTNSLGAVGNLCMDAAIFKGRARAGSRKLILSDAAAYAKEHGTTAYEVLVNVTKKAVMEYRT